MGILDNFAEYINETYGSKGEQGLAAWTNFVNNIMATKAPGTTSHLLWNKTDLSGAQRTAMSESLMDLLGVRKPDLLQAAEMGKEDMGPFRWRRPVKNVWESGYGSFVLDAEDFINHKGAEDIFQKLMYITPNINVTGVDDPQFKMGARYQPKFLRQTSEHVANAEGILKGKALIFDVETAGLEKDSGIWQLSARMVDNANVGVDDAGMVKEFLFDNPNMDMGIYRINGQSVDFKTYYEMQTKRGKIKWQKDFAKGAEEFLDMALQSDYLVGQNVAFDIEHLMYGFDKVDGGVSDQLAGKIAQFKTMIDEGKVLDTQIMSEMLFGKTITIDEALKGKTQFTPTSMENIMLRTNLLEEIANELGDGGWDIVKEKITRGAHHADVDTFFEGYLYKFELESLIQGKNKRTSLRALAEDEFLPDADIIEEIRAASAITPITRLGGEMERMTPMEYLTRHTSKLNAQMTPLDLSRAPFEAGMFSRWADSILDEDGRLRMGRSLIDSGFADIPGIAKGGLQEKAIKMGLPFAGLSSIDRLITTQLSRLSPNAQNAHLRELLGDISGTALVEKRQGFQRYSQNLAISPDIIALAEEEGILQTRFGAVMRGEADAFQEAKWSIVKSDKKQGMALVADIFKDKEEMKSFASWIGGEGLEPKAYEAFLEGVGLTAEDAKTLSVNLFDFDEGKHVEEVMRRGVQIGFIDGGRPGAEMAIDTDIRVRNSIKLFEQLGFGVDSPDRMTMRTAIVGMTDAVRGQVGADMLMTGATTTAEINDDYVANLARAAQMSEEVYGSIANDRFRQTMIDMGKGRSSAAASKVYDAVKDVNAKGVGIGAATLIGGYYFLKSRGEQQEYDESLDFQGYEEEPAFMPMRRGQQDPLATAGLVQGLDRNKVAHSQMGPSKYDHLF